MGCIGEKYVLGMLVSKDCCGEKLGPPALPRRPPTLPRCSFSPAPPPPRPPRPQVLVSIQSLIMVDEPFYNEPGYEQRASEAQSNAYSANIM